MKNLLHHRLGFISLLFVFILLACSENDPTYSEPTDNKSASGFVIPSAIQAAVLPPEGTLTALIYIDNGVSPLSSQQINLENGQKTVDFKISLSPGSYTMTIKFTFDDPRFGGPIDIAEASKVVSVEAGSTQNLVFSTADYSYPDTDNDTVYNIIEIEQGTDPNDETSKPSLSCSIDSGDIICSDIVFTIGGTVTGLVGSGLVLQNNAGDDLVIDRNGGFAFSAALEDQSPYNVVVTQQPTNPGQRCVVSNGAGQLSGTNVSNMSVTCSALTFGIGGTVTGLAGSGLILQNNAGNDLVIDRNGGFAFSTALEDQSPYNVVVTQQPTNPGQRCVVNNGAGQLSGTNVSNISITCSTLTFNVGGTVTGLVGNGLELQNNAGDNSVIERRVIDKDGGFTLSTALKDQSSYNVTIVKQPANPSQRCVVKNGTGQLNGANVNNISVTCSTLKFSIGGTVTGLVGRSDFLVLQNNAGDDLNINADGEFTFSKVLDDQASYEVTVLKTSARLECFVINGAGQLNGANVKNIRVTCLGDILNPLIDITVTGLAGSGLVLQNNAADDVAVNADGDFKFTTKDGDRYNITVLTQPKNPSQTCTITNGEGRLNGVDVINVMVDCSGAWVPMNNGLFGGLVYALAANPVDPTTVYAGTWGGGVFKSLDGGVNWSAVNTGLTDQRVRVLSIDPLNPTTIYAGTSDGGVFKSIDGGSNWSAIGLTNHSVRALRVDPQNPTIVYVGTLGGGVFKSIDGGITWDVVNTRLSSLLVYALVIDSANPNTLYAGTWGGVFKSTDAGASWNAVNVGLSDDRSVRALSIDPVNPATIYAGTDSGGVFKSVDGGANWRAMNTGFLGQSVSALSIDRMNPATVYVGTNGGGVFKSINGGANWSTVNTGLTDLTVHALSIDPLNSITVYAGTGGGGVFKSIDEGVNWSAVNTRITNLYVEALSIDPVDPSIVYSGTLGGGVFKSTDGGSNWHAVNTGLTSRRVRALSIDPMNPATVYAGTNGGGVFKSTDGGASWRATNTGLADLAVYALSAIDPATPTTIYAGTWGGGVFKSLDGGANWRAVNTGLTNRYVQVLSIDPMNPATVYAGTWGGGVFKSLDGGANWSAINTALTELRVQALSIDPVNSATVYVGAGGSVFKSLDGGTRWRVVNTGFTNLAVYALSIDPLKPTTVYAGVDGGVFKSVDGGASWYAINVGLTNLNIYAFSIDPANPNTVYAGTWGGGVFKHTQQDDSVLPDS